VVVSVNEEVDRTEVDLAHWAAERAGSQGRKRQVEAVHFFLFVFIS
jgi:hypothetical protein